jgi:hypothetical protein
MIAQREKGRWSEMEKAIGMFASLIFVLSMIGVGVAHWSDNIQIEGTVIMGTLTVGWVDNECGENDEPCGKDIASISCRLEDPEEDHKTLKTVYKTLVIEVDNAYPEYVCWVEASIKNAGTTPVDLVGVIVTPGPGLRWDDPDIENVDTGFPVINLWYENADNPGQEISCPTQIDPCDNIRLKGWLHIKENAEECHTYTFTVTLYFVQWGCEGYVIG